ncbi:MAG: hypothetical protein ACK5YO_17185, partial [Planctomyces sp.]
GGGAGGLSLWVRSQAVSSGGLLPVWVWCGDRVGEVRTLRRVGFPDSSLPQSGQGGVGAVCFGGFLSEWLSDGGVFCCCRSAQSGAAITRIPPSLALARC